MKNCNTQKNWVLKNFGSKNNFRFEKVGSEKNFGFEKIFGPKEILGPKNFWYQKKCWVRKNCGSEKNFGSKKIVGLTHLCATNRFLVCSAIVDFGGVLLVLLVLLMTWVIRTPNPLNSAKSPWVVYVSNFSLLALPLLIDFGEGSSCCSSSCDRVKQSQLLVLKPGLEKV